MASDHALARLRYLMVILLSVIVMERFKYE